MKVLFPPKWVGKVLLNLAQEIGCYLPEGVQLLPNLTGRCRFSFQHVGCFWGDSTKFQKPFLGKEIPFLQKSPQESFGDFPPEVFSAKFRTTKKRKKLLFSSMTTREKTNFFFVLVLLNLAENTLLTLSGRNHPTQTQGGNHPQERPPCGEGCGTSSVKFDRSCTPSGENGTLSCVLF